MLALSVSLIGCGSNPALAPTPSSVASKERALPVKIDIPVIKASSSLIRTDLNADGTIEVPSVKTPKQASWYDKYPVPGETGQGIILGHVNGNHQPGIFAKLSELKVGDDIDITLDNNEVKKFVVYDPDSTDKYPNYLQVSKEAFPTKQVYDMAKDSEIRVITCGGILDRTAGSYKDNIIVFAKLRS